MATVLRVFCYHLFALLLLISPTQGDDISTTCTSEGHCLHSERPKCNVPGLATTANHNNLYRSGGSAQAYKPDQPEKRTVCDPDYYSSNSRKRRLRYANWPFSRTSLRIVPRVEITVSLWSCDSDSRVVSKSKKASSQPRCCYRAFNESAPILEVWQTRPDGTYASLRRGQEDGDCRAKHTFAPGGPAVATFQTVAPGSSGSLAGLGPYGWDFAPYGPPFIHMYVSDPAHTPVLINLPLLLQKNTLEAKAFYWPDWRGAAWVQSAEKDKPYQITSWKANKNGNTVAIEMNVYLTKSGNANERKPPSKHFCRSWIYGLPGSFFIEPITLCAPSMLDFFAL